MISVKKGWSWSGRRRSGSWRSSPSSSGFGEVAGQHGGPVACGRRITALRPTRQADLELVNVGLERPPRNVPHQKPSGFSGSGERGERGGRFSRSLSHVRARARMRKGWKNVPHVPHVPRSHLSRPFQWVPCWRERLSQRSPRTVTTFPGRAIPVNVRVSIYLFFSSAATAR